jgi:hypothetical protein
MSDLRQFEIHGPNCPEDCVINASIDQVTYVYEDFEGITKEQIECMKVGHMVEFGQDDEYRIYRVKDIKKKGSR